jgi:hypothetical protein
MPLLSAVAVAVVLTAGLVAAVARTNQLLVIPLQQETQSQQPSVLVVQLEYGVEMPLEALAQSARYQRTDLFLQQPMAEAAESEALVVQSELAEHRQLDSLVAQVELHRQSEEHSVALAKTEPQTTSLAP